ncbi:MAG: 4-(cytidine 5'-diphospho)-2-C-methyl-D-erythritol kinase [Rhodospirillaceae bacterium]|nr:4-(cytidine 5'-diphospho)-2-C-methyl-D-erythritol kinase [Rhodospirillaceae bacterium]
MTAALTLAAAAKINLTLHITGRRDDGYHELDSLIGFTTVTDTLTLRPADDICLHITGPESHGMKPDESNLAVRAARHMQTHLGVTTGVNIELEKNIPVAAGLGGGSADAAAVILGCTTLWGASNSGPISDQTLALHLGADVPMCRHGQAARIRGIGERVETLPPWPKAWLVLANPRISLATADVFNAFDGPIHTTTEVWSEGEAFEALTTYLTKRENSLTAPARAIAPVIGDVLNKLNSLPGCQLARMSGSGPTCFGLFETADEAKAGRENLRQSQPSWWVETTPLVSKTV